MAKENRKPGRGGQPGGRWPLGRLARRHRFISAAAAFTGVGLIILVLLWFQPQKLFLSKTVSEPVPGVIQTALSTRRRAGRSCCAVPPGA
jgi:hypothetical protein